MAETDNGQCACTFTLGEKFLLRGTFVLSVLIGAYGIWIFSTGAAAAYLAYAVISYFLLMRYTVCARCPHLFEGGECLFLPPGLVRRFVKPRQGELLGWERLVLDSAALGTAAIPLFWLIWIPGLLLLYLAVTAGCWAALVRVACRGKCRVRECPLNRRFQAR